jgi:peptidoglycan/LPS O-acetylase OafA/YrhL
MNEVDLKAIEQKAYRESTQDGLTEIFVGILLVGMGVYFTIKVAFVFIVLFALFAPRLLERLKRKHTYPRMGFVKLYEDPPKKTWLGIFSYMLLVIVVMIFALFIVFSDFSADLWYRWTPTFMGAMLTGAWIYMVGKSGDPRYYGIAVFGLVVGIILSIYRFDSMWTGIKTYLFFMGSCFIGLGTGRFVYFLHRYPLQEESSNVTG